jgi:uncharacterized membrane protein YeaQ/YmgE (transglycosylase-associated protein family)
MVAAQEKTHSISHADIMQSRNGRLTILPIQPVWGRKELFDREGVVGFLWFLIIGAVAGWLAGQIMKGKGFGILGNIVVGIVGAMIGGFALGLLGLGGDGLVGSLVTALIGAIILLFIVGLIKKG